MTASRWDIEERPDWVVVLDERCEASSQGQVAKLIGYSTSMIGQVRKGRWTGSYDKIALAVRGHFMDGTVTCPALGTIKSDVCVGHQRNARQFVGSGPPVRQTMYRKCRACPRFNKEITT